VTHVTFLPNAFARPGLLTTIAYQAATRNLWASSWFAEQRQDLPDSHASEPADETEGSESAEDWEIRMISYLANLAVEDLPSMEILFLNALGSWIFSSANPGDNYEEQHGGQVITALLEAAGQSSSFHPDQQPVSTPEIAAVRAEIANGAREIAAAEGGLGMLISRLMPAAIGELNRLTGDPGSQSYWLYVYGMFMLAGGREGTQGNEPMRAIADTFAGWNTLMAAGFSAPQGLSPKTD